MNREKIYNAKERLDICKTCPYFLKQMVCKKCGCIMAVKSRIKYFDCPLNKWVKDLDTQE